MNSYEDRDIDNLAMILDHSDRIKEAYERFGKTFDAFTDDAVFRDAILMNIVQIGEAANRLSDGCREKLSEIPWGSIIGTRNIIVHGYVQIDDRVIWNIVEKDIPILAARIEKII